MTIEDLLEMSTDKLESLSDFELSKWMSPLIKISKPQLTKEASIAQFKKTKKPAKRKVVKTKKKALKNMTLAEVAAEAGIDNELLLEIQSDIKKVKDG